MVTLHHFTNPLWFADQGGWESGPLDAFYEYVTIAAHALEDLVDYWVTINEPLLMIRLGWIWGLWPPGKHGKPLTAMRVAWRMVQAHNQAYVILSQASNAPIGLAYNVTYYTPARRHPLDWLATRYENYILNHWFLRHTMCDYIGLNYYFHDKIRVGFFPPRLRSTHHGQTAEGFYQTLRSLGRYGKPIIVTENGVDDETDVLRGQYITDHVAAMQRAMAEGVHVDGYMYWTLVSGPEWESGYSRHFGLLEIDHATGERTVRDSALVYKAVIDSWR